MPTLVCANREASGSIAESPFKRSLCVKPLDRLPKGVVLFFCCVRATLAHASALNSFIILCCSLTGGGPVFTGWRISPPVIERQTRVPVDVEAFCLS